MRTHKAISRRNPKAKTKMRLFRKSPTLATNGGTRFLSWLSNRSSSRWCLLRWARNSTNKLLRTSLFFRIHQSRTKRSWCSETTKISNSSKLRASRLRPGLSNCRTTHNGKTTDGPRSTCLDTAKISTSSSFWISNFRSRMTSCRFRKAWYKKRAKRP